MATPGDVPASAPTEVRVQKSRLALFGLLVLCTSLPLFDSNLTVPNKPVQATMEFYSTLMSIPNGSTVLLQSDWTNSTRAESGGEAEAVLRILMRKDCKIAYYSAADAQAPEVARNEIIALNKERKAAGQRVYEQWNDYVGIGFFPNAEGANNAMAADLRKAWAGKKDVSPDGQYTDVFRSPVLKDVHTVADTPVLVIITASNSFNIFIERLYGKAPIAAAVTGVMGPESAIYYASGQLKGLATGLQGVYDLETMMENGINNPGKDGKVAVEWSGHPAVPGFPGMKNYDKGKLYYPTLHVALILLILAVIAGNVSMIRARKAGGQ